MSLRKREQAGNALWSQLVKTILLDASRWKGQFCQDKVVRIYVSPSNSAKEVEARWKKANGDPKIRISLALVLGNHKT